MILYKEMKNIRTTSILLSLLFPLSPSRGADPYTPLSDQERIQILDFTHKGLIQRSKKAACNENPENQRACNQEDPKTMGLPPGIIQAATQALAAFSLMGGGKIIKRTKSETGEETGEEYQDYCQYGAQIATAYSAMEQRTRQKAIGKPDAEVDSDQKRLLYQIARTHQDRAGTAGIERLGWGATTACYVGYASMLGPGSLNPGTYVKMAYSSFLATYFHMKKNNHEEYADRVRDIANALPGAGDCNPITEIDCYCAQEDSPDYAKYCLPIPPPRPKAHPLPPGARSTACLSKSKKEFAQDPACDCVAQNNCADQDLAPLFAMKAFSRQTTTGQSMKTLANLAKGSYHPAQLKNSTLGQNAFKNAMLLADKNLPALKGPFNDKEKKMAQELISAGVPKKLAGSLAQASSTPLLKNSITRSRLLKNEKRKTQRFRKSSPIGKNIFNRKRKQASTDNPFLNKFKKPNQNNELIKYSDQAQGKASISVNREQNIFHLISHRYRNSGWEKLDYQ